MLLPVFFYGTHKESLKSCKKVSRLLMRGYSWETATQGELLETKNTQGLILMDYSSDAGSGPNFHLYILFNCIIEALHYNKDDPRLEKWFYRALESPWGTLTLSAGAFSLPQEMFHNYPRRWMPYLRAILKYMPIYDDVGNGFFTDSIMIPPSQKKNYGFTGNGLCSISGSWSCPFWMAYSNLMVVLAHVCKIDDGEIFSEPLPPGGLASFIHSYNIDINKDIEEGPK